MPISSLGNHLPGTPVMALMHRLMAAATLFVFVACASDAKVGQPSPTPLSVATPSIAATVGGLPTREPATLPVFPEEQAVLAALDRAGIRLTLIGASKFENLLGDNQRTRVFIQQAGAGGAGADVLFLAQPINGVRVCSSKNPDGFNRTEIFIGSRLVSSGEGSQVPFYSISDRYFIQAFGQSFSNALMTGLGTTTPPC